MFWKEMLACVDNNTKNEHNLFYVGKTQNF